MPDYASLGGVPELQWKQADSVQIRDDSTGILEKTMFTSNVQIGYEEGNLGANLTVHGDLHLSGSIFLEEGASVGPWADSGEYVYLTNHGDRVGIGTINSGSYKLQVAGGGGKFGGHISGSAGLKIHASATSDPDDYPTFEVSDYGTPYVGIGISPDTTYGANLEILELDGQESQVGLIRREASALDKNDVLGEIVFGGRLPAAIAGGWKTFRDAAVIRAIISGSGPGTTGWEQDPVTKEIDSAPTQLQFLTTAVDSTTPMVRMTVGNQWGNPTMEGPGVGIGTINLESDSDSEESFGALSELHINAGSTSGYDSNPIITLTRTAGSDFGTGTTLGALNFGGSINDGVDYHAVTAFIKAEVDTGGTTGGAWYSNKAPTKLTFGTTEDDSGITTAIERMIISGSGDVICKHSLGVDAHGFESGNGRGGETPRGMIHVLTNAAYDGVIRITQCNDSSDGPNFILEKSNGSKTVPSALVDDDYLGSLQFAGYNATERKYNGWAVIGARVNGTPGATSEPADIYFATVKDGSQTLTNRMWIMNNGRVGIGDSAPEGVLHINGSGTDLSGVPGIFLENFNDGELDIAVDSGETMQFGEWSGSATLNAKIAANGDFYTNDGTVHNLSDERLKDSVETLYDCLNPLLNLRPVTFDYNGKGQVRTDMGQQVGFIAQEVEKILPNIVSKDTRSEEDNDDLVEYKSIAQGKLIPYLVGAIQSLEQRIKELEDKS